MKNKKLSLEERNNKKTSLIAPFVNSEPTISTELTSIPENEASVNVFQIKKHKAEKVVVKAYQIRVKETTMNNIDRLAKQAGLSRNQFISQLLDIAATNTEITE